MSPELGQGNTEIFPEKTSHMRLFSPIRAEKFHSETIASGIIPQLEIWG